MQPARCDDHGDRQRAGHGGKEHGVGCAGGEASVEQEHERRDAREAAANCRAGSAQPPERAQRRGAQQRRPEQLVIAHGESRLAGAEHERETDQPGAERAAPVEGGLERVRLDQGLGQREQCVQDRADARHRRSDHRGGTQPPERVGVRCEARERAGVHRARRGCDGDQAEPGARADERKRPAPAEADHVGAVEREQHGCDQDGASGQGGRSATCLCGRHDGSSSTFGPRPILIAPSPTSAVTRIGGAPLCRIGR